MLITNATVVTGEQPNRVLGDHAVYVSGDRVQELGPSSRLEKAHPKSRRLDAHGQLLLPGSICAHTHLHRHFARGLVPGGPPAADYAQLLDRRWRPLERGLLEEDIRYAVLGGLIDSIRSGTTTLFDHHSSPSAVDGSLDVIAEAVERSGLRAVLCYAVTDHDGPDVADSGIRENVRFLKRLEAQRSPRLAGMFGLKESLTLSGATLQACRGAAPADAGFHVLVAEHEADQFDCQDRTGMRVVDRLQNQAILGPKAIAAACVHIDAKESLLLQQTGTWVSHQPRSNMRQAVGTAPVESMMRFGVRVCLGTDGLSFDMWDEWRAARAAQRVAHRDIRHMDGRQVGRMALENGGALASLYFPEAPVGRIVPGAAADLILVDYRPSTPMDDTNIEEHITDGLRAGMVTTTMVAGKLLMKDRKLMTLDEEEVTARARELAGRVWKRIGAGSAE
jgi:putative selenium metabolism protein SsnA